VSLFLGAVVLAVLASVFVVYPLVTGRWGMLGDRVSGATLDREAKKRVALAALKDVEYDRVAGKLDDTDYQDLRSRLEMEALDAIQAIEQEEPLVGTAAAAPERHTCGFASPQGSRFCAGCGQPLD
jgi:hypothetical protein